MKPMIPTSLLSFAALALGALVPAGAVLAQCADIAISPVTLPDAQQGVAYTVPFSATGAGGEPVWDATTLPEGLALSGNGVLGGTPAAAGTYPVRVIVASGAGCVAGQFLSLTVAPPAAGTAPVPTITILRTTTEEPASQPLADTMTITDANDAGAPTFSAIVAVDAGQLNVAAGAAAVTVAGNETDEVTLTGTLADINAVLAGSNGAHVNYDGDGTPFAYVTLTLTANDGTETGTATGIVSGPTVIAPRVLVMPPDETQQLPVSARDAVGGAAVGASYGFVSNAPGTVAIDGSGVITSATTLSAASIDITSAGRRPAVSWVSVNNIVPVNVGTNLPSTIAASDGFSAFGSNLGLPSTAYYADIYTIALTAGQAVTIKADSGDDLDTYLILANPDGYIAAGNDDDDTGDLGVGSRIDFVAETAGTYTIEMSTFNGLDTGAYTLIVEATPPRPGATPPKPLRQVLRVKR